MKNAVFLSQVAIADQTHQMVADRLKRLTTDLTAFEQVSGSSFLSLFVFGAAFRSSCPRERLVQPQRRFLATVSLLSLSSLSLVNMKPASAARSTQACFAPQAAQAILATENGLRIRSNCHSRSACVIFTVRIQIFEAGRCTVNPSRFIFAKIPHGSAQDSQFKAFRPRCMTAKHRSSLSLSHWRSYFCRPFFLSSSTRSAVAIRPPPVAIVFRALRTRQLLRKIYHETQEAGKMWWIIRGGKKHSTVPGKPSAISTKHANRGAVSAGHQSRMAFRCPHHASAGEINHLGTFAPSRDLADASQPGGIRRGSSPAR